ncbi:molecular chaperone [Yersinia sp. 2466 StPb PI]|uniref:fimbrial biogenesis chaperone n=1 Tax=Yersinia TaxID=629 RepID=UPI00355B9C73
MKLLKILLIGFFACGGYSAYASIQIMATRIIFDEKSKEQVIRVNNIGDLPSLVQVWLESDRYSMGSGDVEKEDLPFVISPPVSRINAGKGKSFRVFKTEEAKVKFPRDRETLLWVNVLDIPPELENDNSKNKLNLAFRTRLKFLYRPIGLSSDPRVAAENVSWVAKRTGKAINIKGENKSPYHVSIGKFVVTDGSNKIDLTGGMILPYSNYEFDFKVTDLGNQPVKLFYSYITDLGAFVEKEIILE